ncbi:EamA family transporter [Mycolicibacterium litorale]|uniref:Membrane protein n=1 Tax=Mycolicibacterium litorale TaxID=758802 RepID=A0AAD1ITJ8_9MYCO|nr:EamA family transporter [Mycolicibacterium litorale]MCV7416265.1 EamA family transporter [Mycolicibacterium litorale]TDY09517.1 threonine/homoserine efflux transporter RhtA [Mycolicibacterium litorale]BBY17463.1 membrane protein [Mycolicibacterium litorale]
MTAAGALTTPHRSANQFRVGLLFAVSSALAFGMSGPLGKSLMVAGWSPTAAVTARLAGGALLMAVFATVMRPGWIREAATHWRTVLAYGAVPIAGAQLFYYNAVSHLSVAVALLLEYTAPILVVAWVWLSTRRRPSHLTLAGVAVAVTGIMLVLGIVGTGGFAGLDINLVGVGWGMAAAVCAACYFLMSERAGTGGDDSGVHPITLAAGGLAVGGAVTALLGMLGVMPLTFTANDTVIAGWTTSWVVPVIALGLIPTAVAYTLGIIGIARLRPRFASLVGLSEVLFAVLAAWVMLGESITPIQAVGAVVVLTGLVLARQGEREVVAEVMWPETPPQKRTDTDSVGCS